MSSEVGQRDVRESPHLHREPDDLRDPDIAAQVAAAAMHRRSRHVSRLSDERAVATRGAASGTAMCFWVPHFSPRDLRILWHTSACGKL
jgi:hypothetical protein